MKKSIILISALSFSMILSIFSLFAQENVSIEQLRATKLSMITHIDSDLEGNTYYAAMYAGGLTIAGEHMNGDPSAYVVYAKDKKNEIIWAKHFPFVVVDMAGAENGVWIIAQSRKAFTLIDGSNRTFSKAVIIILLSNKGKIEYIAESGSKKGNVYPIAIDYNINQELTFLLRFNETVDFGSRTFHKEMEKNSILIHLNNDYTLAWTTLLTGGDSYIYGVWAEDFCSDNEGNFWICGEMSGEVKCDSLTHTTHLTTYEAGESLYDKESFLLKLDSNGNAEILEKIITDAETESISCLKDGNIMISGYFEGDISKENLGISYFGEQKFKCSINPITNTSEDGFAAKYTREGKCLWVVRSKGALSNRITEHCEDKKGNIYLSGFANFELGFDAVEGSSPVSPVTSKDNNNPYGFSDAFIVKINSSGKFIWIKRGGGNNADDLKCIHYSNGKIHAGGSFTAAIIFDEQQVNMRSTYYSGTEIIIEVE